MVMERMGGDGEGMVMEHRCGRRSFAHPAVDRWM